MPPPPPPPAAAAEQLPCAASNSSGSSGGWRSRAGGAGGASRTRPRPPAGEPPAVPLQMTAETRARLMSTPVRRCHREQSILACPALPPACWMGHSPPAVSAAPTCNAHGARSCMQPQTGIGKRLLKASIVEFQVQCQRCQKLCRCTPHPGSPQPASTLRGGRRRPLAATPSPSHVRQPVCRATVCLTGCGRWMTPTSTIPKSLSSRKAGALATRRGTRMMAVGARTAELPAVQRWPGQWQPSLPALRGAPRCSGQPSLQAHR